MSSFAMPDDSLHSLSDSQTLRLGKRGSGPILCGHGFLVIFSSSRNNGQFGIRAPMHKNGVNSR